MQSHEASHQEAMGVSVPNSFPSLVAWPSNLPKDGEHTGKGSLVQR